MRGNVRWMSVPVALAALLGTVRAEEDKPIDAGKAEAFKSQSYDVKEKGKVTITLAFPAGKEAVVTVRGKVQVRDGKFVGQRGRGRLLKRQAAYF